MRSLVSRRGSKRVIENWGGVSKGSGGPRPEGPIRAPSGPIGAPRGPKRVPRGPKRVPRGPKGAPRGPKRPREVREAPREVRNGPREVREMLSTLTSNPPFPPPSSPSRSDSEEGSLTRLPFWGPAGPLFFASAAGRRSALADGHVRASARQSGTKHARNWVRSIGPTRTNSEGL